MAPTHISPHWEEVILDLLAPLLDPKTLATASCVSKSWHSTLSSDHLWTPLCLSHYPSLANYSSRPSSVSPRRLFALLKSSSARRHRTPRVPRIALADLIFAVDLFCQDAPAFSVAVPGDELVGVCDNQVFRFDIDVVDAMEMVTVDRRKSVRAVWNVVMKDGWGGGFLMLDRTGSGRVVGLDEMWFSEELPGSATGGSAGGSSCLVAELGLVLGVCGGGGNEMMMRRRVVRVRFGLMSALEWRYVSVDDGLLYLQPFLLPSDV